MGMHRQRIANASPTSYRERLLPRLQSCLQCSPRAVYSQARAINNTQFSP